MSVNVTQIESLVRGLVLDTNETGIETQFTGAELLSAVNATKNDFFSKRPEAFATGSTVVTSAPDDLETLDSGALAIQPWALQTFCYGVAAFLMFQRGKDAYYREAAEALQSRYEKR